MKNNLVPINFLKTPTDNSSTISDLKKFWKIILPLILHREQHFEEIWKNATEEEIFAELVFCIFTPQSKSVICWNAVIDLVRRNMIFCQKDVEIAKVINKVRFRNNKAKYVVEARKFFTINDNIKIRKKLTSFKNVYYLRDWIVQNIKGIGYKEAGHFLRNISIAKDFAILDRHILKNLYIYKIINKIPQTLNVKTYLEIEKKMQNFAKNIKIPMAHLDMLFWCKKTGGIFK
ncbi:MAG: N-glycosylase/DNA lyase [Endomicrobium sp.]|jgi:N-glycosylase/DNA lyase|nr:N-glycosylase/DNA lyase [Endomicrobium sp.]